MTMNLFWLCAIGIVAAMAGFWSGRLSMFTRIVGDEQVAGAEIQGMEGGQSVKMLDMVEPVQSKKQVQSAEIQGMEQMHNTKMQSMEDVQGAETQGMEQAQNIEIIEMPRERIQSAETPNSKAPNSKTQKGRMSHRKSAKNKESVIGRFMLYPNRRKNQNNERRIPLGWAIGSPAEGAVYTFNDGRRKGAMVRTTQGCLYAPASGKIIKLYPMGNQMILRTDFGVELLLRVGGAINEITGEYFRPRILQNEIVNKGKLLLEYDREGLIEEGEDTDIFVSVEAAEDFRNITVTEKAQVKQGEEILWVMDHSRIVTGK